MKYILFIVCSFLSSLVMAKEEVRTGLGGVAHNLMSPVSVFSSFVNSACLLLGFSFLFACLIKYIEHRRSPLMVSISTVIFFLIAGILLLLLPLAYYITENGLPFWVLEL